MRQVGGVGPMAFALVVVVAVAAACGADDGPEVAVPTEPAVQSAPPEAAESDDSGTTVDVADAALPASMTGSMTLEGTPSMGGRNVRFHVTTELVEAADGTLSGTLEAVVADGESAAGGPLTDEPIQVDGRRSGPDLELVLVDFVDTLSCEYSGVVLAVTTTDGQRWTQTSMDGSRVCPGGEAEEEFIRSFRLVAL